jgi:hypothetical protein
MALVFSQMYNNRIKDHARRMAAQKLSQRCSALFNKIRRAFLHLYAEQLKMKEDVLAWLDGHFCKQRQSRPYNH